MKWIKRLLGFSTPLEKKQKELSTLWKEAMEYQRNGDLRSYAKIVKKIEGIENELVEMMNGA